MAKRAERRVVKRTRRRGEVRDIVPYARSAFELSLERCCLVERWLKKGRRSSAME